MRINTPELNKVIIGWIYNESYRSLWRVSKWYDFEDLVQDGLMIAIKCRIRYGDVDPAHFTALVKTSFKNHIINLQRRGSSGVEEVYIADLNEAKDTPDKEIEILDAICDPEFPEQEIACTLAELPEPIKAVLRLFLSEDSLHKLRMPMRATLTDDETPAKRLKRLAGWAEDRDFESELRKLLHPG